MPRPNLFVLGAMKSGTTSMWRYLEQHPDIFMTSIKEPRTLCRESQPGWRGPDAFPRGIAERRRYLSLFDDARDEPVRGEATPYYLYDRTSRDEILRLAPEARLVAILRHPIDRAYSNYLMKRQQGWETLPFEEALAAEPTRIRDGWRLSWHYGSFGRYRSQIEHYLKEFEPSRLEVVLFDDLAHDARAVMRRIYRFLGVDDSFEPDTSTVHGRARLSRAPRVHRWLFEESGLRNRLKRMLPGRVAKALRHAAERANSSWNELPPPPLEPATRARLTREWRDEILALEDLIGRDLAHWREV